MQAVSVTGAQPRKKDSPFGAKHRCSRKSIKRPAPVCIEFEREIRVRTVPNPGRVDFICRSFSAYLYRVCVHRQLVISTSPRASREILATNCRELVGKYDVTTCLSTAGPSTRWPTSPFSFSNPRLIRPVNYSLSRAYLTHALFFLSSDASSKMIQRRRRGETVSRITASARRTFIGARMTISRYF